MDGVCVCRAPALTGTRATTCVARRPVAARVPAASHSPTRLLQIEKVLYVHKVYDSIVKRVRKFHIH